MQAINGKSFVGNKTRCMNQKFSSVTYVSHCQCRSEAVLTKFITASMLTPLKGFYQGVCWRNPLSLEGEKSCKWSYEIYSLSVISPEAGNRALRHEQPDFGDQLTDSPLENVIIYIHYPW